MKKLDDVFKKDKEKKSSILSKKIKANNDLSVPRKIYNSDYEIIREFAFKNRLTLLEVTEYLYEFIKDGSSGIKKADVENHINVMEDDEFERENLKSIRTSSNLFKVLRKISEEKNITLRHLLSFLVHENLKE